MCFLDSVSELPEEANTESNAKGADGTHFRSAYLLPRHSQ